MLFRSTTKQYINDAELGRRLLVMLSLVYEQLHSKGLSLNTLLGSIDVPKFISCIKAFEVVSRNKKTDLERQINSICIKLYTHLSHHFSVILHKTEDEPFNP